MVASFNLTGNDYCVTEAEPNLSRIQKGSTANCVVDVISFDGTGVDV